MKSCPTVIRYLHQLKIQQNISMMMLQRIQQCLPHPISTFFHKGSSSATLGPSCFFFFPTVTNVLRFGDLFEKFEAC
jgi:hypothetical protein